MRLRWSLISTGWPTAQPLAHAAGGVGQHDRAAARRGGDPHAVHDRLDAAALVQVGAAEQHHDALRAADLQRADPPGVAGDRRRQEAGQVGDRTSTSAGPRASAAGTQPEPMTSATSWRGAPLSSAQRRAAVGGEGGRVGAQVVGHARDATDSPVPGVHLWLGPRLLECWSE